MVVSRFLIYSRVAKLIQYNVKLTISTFAETKSGKSCVLPSSVILGNKAATLQRHQISFYSLKLEVCYFTLRNAIYL